jgi:hypothetical protein
MTNATHIGRSNIGTVANKLVSLVERTEGRNAVARVLWVNQDDRTEAMPVGVFEELFRELTSEEIAQTR